MWVVNDRGQQGDGFAEFRIAAAQQAPTPEAGTFPGLVQPALRHQQLDLQQPNGWRVGIVALCLAELCPGAGRVAAVDSDRRQSLTGARAQRRTRRLGSNPFQQREFLAAVIHVIVRVTQRVEGVIVQFVDTRETAHEQRLEQTDRKFWTPLVQGLIGELDKARQGHPPGVERRLQSRRWQRLEYYRPEFLGTHRRRLRATAAAALVFQARTAKTRLVATRFRQSRGPEIVVRGRRCTPYRPAEDGAECVGALRVQGVTCGSALAENLGPKPVDEVVERVRGKSRPDGTTNQFFESLMRQYGD